MGRLTDDDQAVSKRLLTVGEIAPLIAARVVPVAETERLALAQARGRVLAENVVAPLDLPPFDNAAVDGYAVRHADLNTQGETTLTIAERILAGQTASVALPRHAAIRIFTGAPMPAGADTVFMQEDAKLEGGKVVAPPGLQRGDNRRLAGEDVRRGDVALRAGRVLTVADIALAAALGVTDVIVRRRLSVALFSTGDELIEPGQPLLQAARYDANRPLLKGLCESLQADVTDLGILPDDPALLSDALKAAAAHHDVVLSSGGVSSGDADHVRDAVTAIGRIAFWRIAIKPGRPVALGVITDHADHEAAFVGLPGNPVAAFVTFVFVVRPLLMQLSGGTITSPMALPVRAAFSYRKKPGRRDYVRVKLARADDGGVEAIKHEPDSSGIITSLTMTDGLVEITEDETEIAPGDTVGFLPYAVLTS